MSLAEKKSIVRHFLARCNDYAADQIERYEARLASADEAERNSLKRKIDQWTSYREFNDYALRELETTELDGWFDDDGRDTK
ncbi:MAG: hypothetical protein R3305_03805 [Gammaproteobacteria bacterium]|nr:hypothetical protein [Gammaproteobacteria bacterium]